VSLYNIEYKPLINISDRFNTIIQSLEKNSDVLSRMSFDVMEGMEQEARMLAAWADITGNRKEDFRRASECLQQTTDVLSRSEKTAFGMISDVDCTVIDGNHGDIQSYSGDSSSLNKYLEFFRDHAFTTGTTDWSTFTRADWRYILPLIYVLSITDRDIYTRIWDIIRPFIIGRYDRNNNNQDLQDSGDEDPCVSPDVKTGCGVSDLPEEDFADAESEVNAEQGAACGTIDDLLDEMPEEMPDETQTSSGGGGGGAESGSGSGAGSGAGRADTDSDHGIGDDSLLLDADKRKKDLDREMDLIDGDRGSAGGAASGSSGESVAGGSGSSGTPIPETFVAGSGMSIAAPVIGVASAGSIVASGAALSNSLKADKDGLEKGNIKQTTPPVINAKEGNGIFGGNLSTEYVILASTVSLLFTGVSVAASVYRNNKRDKKNARFRTGYAVSAILDSGEIQVR